MRVGGMGAVDKGQSPQKSLSGRDQGAARLVTKFVGSKGKATQFVYNPGRWGTQEKGDKHLSCKNIWYRNTWKAWTYNLNKWDYINKLSEYVQACLCETFLPTLLVLSASLRASCTGLGLCMELCLDLWNQSSYQAGVICHSSLPSQWFSTMLCYTVCT